MKIVIRHTMKSKGLFTTVILDSVTLTPVSYCKERSAKLWGSTTQASKEASEAVARCICIDLDLWTKRELAEFTRTEQV